MTVDAEGRLVDEHYGRGNLTERILEALRDAGKDTGALDAADLSSIDHFHTGGRRATLDLAHLAGITSGMRVLDAGGGLGGPARVLASEFGCRVEVLDITEEFCRAGEMLTERTGLSDLVSFRHGSALEMPYPDASFEFVWTQHSSMNIADKEQLYREIHRVLRPGGRLAMHEIMAGPNSPVHFPVPWACKPEISHLLPPEEVRSLLAAIGFKELAWVDETASAAEWFQRRSRAKPSEGSLPPGLTLLMGPDSGEMFQNQVRNLRENRITLIQSVFERA